MKKAYGGAIIELLAGILMMMALVGCVVVYLVMTEAATVLQEITGLLIGVISSILFSAGIVLSILNDISSKMKDNRREEAIRKRVLKGENNDSKD